MKGKLDKNGNLHIERAGKMIQQYCHYASGSKCSSFCSNFRELGTPQGLTVLALCQGIELAFNEFSDERVSPKAESEA